MHVAADGRRAAVDPSNAKQRGKKGRRGREKDRERERENERERRERKGLVGHKWNRGSGR